MSNLHCINLKTTVKKNTLLYIDSTCSYLLLRQLRTTIYPLILTTFC